MEEHLSDRPGEKTTSCRMVPGRDGCHDGFNSAAAEFMATGERIVSTEIYQ